MSDVIKTLSDPAIAEAIERLVAAGIKFVVPKPVREALNHDVVKSGGKAFEAFGNMQRMQLPDLEELREHVKKHPSEYEGADLMREEDCVEWMLAGNDPRIVTQHASSVAELLAVIDKDGRTRVIRMLKEYMAPGGPIDWTQAGTNKLGRAFDGATPTELTVAAGVLEVVGQLFAAWHIELNDRRLPSAIDGLAKLCEKVQLAHDKDVYVSSASLMSAAYVKEPVLQLRDAAIIAAGVEMMRTGIEAGKLAAAETQLESPRKKPRASIEL